MIAQRKHLKQPTLYVEQASQEYDTIDVYYLNIFGYRAPIGKPWYDVFKGWYVINHNEQFVTLSKYPILPPRKGWGSRVFWLLSMLPINTSKCLCRYRADLMDVTYITYQQATDWMIEELHIQYPKSKNSVITYITRILLGTTLLCVEISWLGWNVSIKRRLLELLAIVTNQVTSTNVHSTTN